MEIFFPPEDEKENKIKIELHGSLEGKTFSKKTSRVVEPIRVSKKHVCASDMGE